MKTTIFSIIILISFSLFGQSNTYWQQHVDYTMEIDMNVENYQFDGKQKLVYTNNSPDDLYKVFYHLQFNAFQPGSEMDIRLQNVVDPDRRMINNIGTLEEPIYESRISKLKPNEIGYQKIISLKQNGKPVKYEVIGTILKVTLNTPIHAGTKATFDMEFKGQVPVQIRRSGRNNAEGVALSMTQWYPKLAEYDFEGWHANQYIAREFHGVWGDFDVTIHIDKNYTVAGTGYLQNSQQVGHGYEDKSKKLKLPKGDKLTWHFKAPNVHDYTWAADTDYIHDIYEIKNGPKLRFFYKKTLEDKYLQNWKNLQSKTGELMNFFSENIGEYPYKEYSVIQGGDGGMEYAMCTLITGEREFKSLFGVTSHELAHMWFQLILASNESKHPWMDEGFTVYISNMAVNTVLKEGKEDVHKGSYNHYFHVVNKGIEEPLSTHADRYNTNLAYGMGSYSKGNIFLSQLGYIIGEENLAKTIKKFYQDFKFKHPNPNDIKRTAEKISGIQLEWYLNEWTQTIHTIDYAVKSVSNKEITLNRIGQMPMPIDLTVTYTDGTTENFYIPLQMMLGKKPTQATVLPYWAWGNPNFTFTTKKTIKKVGIDTSLLMADIDRSNNTFEVK